MPAYRIVRTSDTFIIGNDGLPKKGKTIIIELTDYDEQHTFDVEHFDPDLIEEKANALLETRRRLDALGG